jgi:hypothetical protein
MKHVFIIIAVFAFFVSCKKAIKNEIKFAEIQGFEEISFVKPKMTNSSVVNSKDDLLGYWVGSFDANLTTNEKDSMYRSNPDAENILNRKITFSIDEIEGDSIIGHSIVAGNISLFKGVLVENENYFIVEAEEFKRANYDGIFNISIAKSDSVFEGYWTAFYPNQVNIPQRKFSLKKKFFIYDSNASLEMIFINTDKSNSIKVTDTIDDEVEVYEDVEYYSTTDNVFLKNASVELLSSDFVSNLSKADIFILRNSIFARHGFAFRDKQLRMYFEFYDWYMPVFGDVKDDLTEIEKENIELLLRYEQNALEYYDTFGR